MQSPGGSMAARADLRSGGARRPSPEAPPSQLTAVADPVRTRPRPAMLRRYQLDESRRRQLAHAMRPANERAFLTGMGFAAYLVVAVVVILGAHSIIGDAWSRVANGYYVLFSRDPHLGAIGFVWNPLPSLAVLPFLPLKVVWPAMVTSGFAGSVVSAVCMAAAVWQVHATAQDWLVGRRAAFLVTALFALNPMILYYGANGMSEAMFILAMLVCVRYLTRWAQNGRVEPLAVAGMAIAAAYLTRYEAAVAAAGGFLAVVILSAGRRNGHSRDRIEEGLADGVVFAAPFVTAFVGWALASWLIAGDPFQQFTSVYGVVSQLAVAQSSVAQATGQGTAGAYGWVLRQLFGLEPGILLLGVFGIGATIRGRATMTMPAVGVLGAVVVFAAFDFLSGRTLGWLRYSIAIVPLASLLALAVLAPAPWTAGTSETGRPRWFPRLRLDLGARTGARIRRAAVIGTLAAVTLAVPVGAMTMLDPSQNPPDGGEAFQLRPILYPGEPLTAYTPTGQYEAGLQASRFLDGMSLGSGQVLLDGAMGFPIILESANPGQFTITSDRDFHQALLDPLSFGVKYLLVPVNVGYQSLDAINRAYPGIYDHGATIAPTLVAQFGAGPNAWRLYRVSS